MGRKHRVRSHHWHQGILVARDIIFGDLDAAKRFVESLECDSFKIFDEIDEVVWSGSGPLSSTYA